jgi:hypothetical protein
VEEGPLHVAVQSKACTVFSHCNTGIVGSNYIQGVDGWLRFSVLVLSCVSRGLSTG